MLQWSAQRSVLLMAALIPLAFLLGTRFGPAAHPAATLDPGLRATAPGPVARVAVDPSPVAGDPVRSFLDVDPTTASSLASESSSSTSTSTSSSSSLGPISAHPEAPHAAPLAILPVAVDPNIVVDVPVPSHAPHAPHAAPASPSPSPSHIPLQPTLAPDALTVRGARWRESPVGLFSFSAATVNVLEQSRASYAKYQQLLRDLAAHRQPDIANYGVIPPRDPRWRARENFFKPPIAVPKTAIARIGGGGDGGKLVLNVGAYDQKTAATERECIVYSLGSNNDFSFEASVVSKMGCTVFTFDCTITLKAKVPPKTTFRNWCLGRKDEVTANGWTYKRLGTVTSELGHDHIDLLKIDIEGYEFSVMHDLVQWPIIPSQILIEVHGPSRDLSVGENNGRLDHWTQLFTELDHRGYRTVAFEPNPLCQHCSEYTLVHVPAEDRGVLGG